MHKHIVRLIGRDLSCLRPGGGFGYWPGHGGGYADVSITQFAILALRSAALAGYPVAKVHPGVWSGTVNYLKELQSEDGSFPYHRGAESSAGMTAAALSTLLLCREQIALDKEPLPEGLDDRIKSAFDSLGAGFDVSMNRMHSEKPGPYHYCYLYGVERVGVISGRNEIGGVSWYLRGARYLVDEQEKGGRWVDRRCMDPQDVLGTTFALLFLKRATIPTPTLTPGGH